MKLTSKGVDWRSALLDLSDNTRCAPCGSHQVCEGLEGTGSLRICRWRFCFVVLCTARGFALGVLRESALGLVLELRGSEGAARRLGNYLITRRVGWCGGGCCGSFVVGVGDG
jgi:hypothetical protein